MVLSVRISMGCGCEADGCFVPRYSGTLDSDPKNSDRKLEIQKEKRPFKQERFFESLLFLYSVAHFEKDKPRYCIIRKASNFVFHRFCVLYCQSCPIKIVNFARRSETLSAVLKSGF